MTTDIPSKTDNANVTVSDPFWSQEISILWNKKRWIEFFPTKDMNEIEKLNAIARLFIYTSILLLVYKGEIWPLYIAIFGLGITLFLYKTLGSTSSSDKHISKAELSIINDKNNDKCTRPTKDNPFMNVTVNEYMDDPTRPEACEYEKVKPNVETHFDHNLYKDINDLFDKNNSQRMYYTAPITTVPNDQGGYAKWLYNIPATCKEDQENCLRYEDTRANRKPVGDFENNPINLFTDERVL